MYCPFARALCFCHSARIADVCHSGIHAVGGGLWPHDVATPSLSDMAPCRPLWASRERRSVRRVRSHALFCAAVADPSPKQSSLVGQCQPCCAVHRATRRLADHAEGPWSLANHTLAAKRCCCASSVWPSPLRCLASDRGARAGCRQCLSIPAAAVDDHERARQSHLFRGPRNRRTAAAAAATHHASPNKDYSLQRVGEKDRAGAVTPLLSCSTVGHRLSRNTGPPHPDDHDRTLRNAAGSNVRSRHGTLRARSLRERQTNTAP